MPPSFVISQVLGRTAMNKGSPDNITVVVVDLAQADAVAEQTQPTAAAHPQQRAELPPVQQQQGEQPQPEPLTHGEPQLAAVLAPASRCASQAAKPSLLFGAAATSGSPAKADLLIEAAAGARCLTKACSLFEAAAAGRCPTMVGSLFEAEAAGLCPSHAGAEAAKEQILGDTSPAKCPSQAAKDTLCELLQRSASSSATHALPPSCHLQQSTSRSSSDVLNTQLPLCRVPSTSSSH